MAQAPVMQHGQIKAAAVPTHQLRCVFFNRVEKGLNDLALADAIPVGEGVNAQALGISKDTADHQHPLQIQRQKIALAFVFARLHPGGMHLLVALRFITRVQ